MVMIVGYDIMIMMIIGLQYDDDDDRIITIQ